ncbi:hypothetical protein CHUAL_004324 [Chamberlinius hualienensis]
MLIFQFLSISVNAVIISQDASTELNITNVDLNIGKLEIDKTTIKRGLDNATLEIDSEFVESVSNTTHRLKSRSYDSGPIDVGYRAGQFYRGRPGDPHFWLIPCPSVKYRTYDGYCNNLVYPKWGQAAKPYARLLLPKYDDGKGSPRIRGVYGEPLPCPRCISLRLARDVYREYPYFSHMLMQWGQFVNHDMTNKPVWTNQVGSEVPCCDSNTRMHPDCYPLEIPYDDPFYSRYRKRCMNFVRSKPYPGRDYVSVYREQYNDNTAFIDGSGIYGSTKTEAYKLRTLFGGKLKTTRMDGYKDLLPTASEGLCRNQVCFYAGDFRVNMFPSLASMHTLFVRQHNYIVDKLQQLNPNWDDERLYQEGRKIVGAIIQHITYNEFLPIILGRMQMGHYGLLLQTPGYFNGYNAHLNPTLYNAFTAAAFRFGHSLVQPKFKRYHGNHMELPWSPWLGDEYFNTSCMWKYGEMDSILLGLVDQHAQITDPFFSVEITNRLYEPGELGGGLDLISLNIQRGRDNGLPPYNDWREYCGLKRVKSFQELRHHMNEYAVEVFEAMYRSVDDIDLYPGGIAETALPGGVVGPVFSCIIGRQFFKLRSGDRFWFENGPQSVGPASFTPDQLLEIRKSSLARIICDNTDDIETLQSRVMYVSNEWNPRASCSDYATIPNIDLTKWKEVNYNYYTGSNVVPEYRTDSN